MTETGGVENDRSLKLLKERLRVPLSGGVATAAKFSTEIPPVALWASAAEAATEIVKCPDQPKVGPRPAAARNDRERLPQIGYPGRGKVRAINAKTNTAVEVAVPVLVSKRPRPTNPSASAVLVRRPTRSDGFIVKYSWCWIPRWKPCPKIIKLERKAPT